MSYIYLGKTKAGHCIVDTDDLVTDVFHDDELNSLKKLGVKLSKFSKENSFIGISANDNVYEIYVNGYNKPIYKGMFPKSCSYSDIFAMDIHITDIGIVKNQIVVAVICRCWIKCDIEIPVCMVHVLAMPFKNIRSGTYLACYTKEPVYFSTPDVLTRQYEQCQGYYIDKCLPVKPAITINKDCINVLGVKYNDVPSYDELDSKLKFFHI